MVSLQYVPYAEIDTLSPDKKVDKLLDIVKKNKIVVMQGRLRPVEETALIQRTMESVNKYFKGIEHCVIYPTSSHNKKLFIRLKHMLVSLLAGRIDGMTIIGPATIVKEIKRNPDKIELSLYNGRKQNGKR